MKPPVSILNPAFKYVGSAKTSVDATFAVLGWFLLLGLALACLHLS